MTTISPLDKLLPINLHIHALDENNLPITLSAYYLATPKHYMFILFDSKHRAYSMYNNDIRFYTELCIQSITYMDDGNTLKVMCTNAHSSQTVLRYKFRLNAKFTEDLINEQIAAMVSMKIKLLHEFYPYVTST